MRCPFLMLNSHESSDFGWGIATALAVSSQGPLRFLRQGALSTARFGLCGEADDAAADGQAAWRMKISTGGAHQWMVHCMENPTKNG